MIRMIKTEQLVNLRDLFACRNEWMLTDKQGLKTEWKYILTKKVIGINV